MQEFQSGGKMAMLEQKLDFTKKLMERNIELLLDRGERLSDLQEQTGKLQEMAAVFKKRSREVRRLKMMQNAKYGLVLGTAIAAGVAIVLSPLLAVS
jgi:hypothetical protein